MSRTDRKAQYIADVYRGEVAEANDTSALLEKLILEYQRTEKAVEVDFRKLVDWLPMGDYLTHQIHPYPAKLLPQIAHFFLRARKFTSRVGPVLDPFSGTGTVALEASLAGLQPYVADANPLARLITLVKTTPYDTTEILSRLEKLLKDARGGPAASPREVVNKKYWYYDHHVPALDILIDQISQIDCRSARSFFLVSFSLLSRKLSLSDPTISVPVRIKEKERFGSEKNKKISKHLENIKSLDPFLEFERICKKNIQKISNTNQVDSSRQAAQEVGDDARWLKDPESNLVGKLPNNSVPLIVTSPPYGSAQKYIRATSLSLNWTGLVPPALLASYEAKTIGREHLSKCRPENFANFEASLPIAYETLLDQISKRNVLRGHITREYLQDMTNALKEMCRVATTNATVIVAIGNNLVCGLELRNDDFIREIMGRFGFELTLHLCDRIPSRSLMTKRNKTASVIQKESVLFFTRK